MIFTDNFTPTNYSLNGDLTQADMNIPINGLNTFVDTLKNLSSDTFVSSSGTATYTITENNVICLYVDAAGANAIINLPAGALQTASSILIKKVDQSSNTVTVRANGSELIENINEFLTVPANSEYVLQIPNQSVELNPQNGNTNIWRVIREDQNLEYFSFSGYHAGTTMAVADQVYPAIMSTEIVDKSGSFNTTTYQYTCPADGVIITSGTIGNYHATLARNFNIFLRKNGATAKVWQYQANAGDWGVSFVGTFTVVKGDVLQLFSSASIAGTNLRSSGGGGATGEFTIDYKNLTNV